MAAFCRWIGHKGFIILLDQEIGAKLSATTLKITRLNALIDKYDQRL